MRGERGPHTTPNGGGGWGAELNQLRMLYLSLLRGLVEIHWTVQSFCGESALKPLVDVQNRILRRVCGTFHTANHWFIGAMSGVEPIPISIQRKMLETGERYRRGLPLANPWLAEEPNPSRTSFSSTLKHLGF